MISALPPVQEEAFSRRDFVRSPRRGRNAVRLSTIRTVLPLGRGERFPLPMNRGGRARRSARAVRRSPGTERRARSDAPYLFWWVHGFKARMVSRNSLPVRNERGEGHPTADTLTHLQARRPSSPPSEG